MGDFRLEYYRTFVCVAEAGSISGAADALRLSQPAVTHSIHQLEGHLNCALFERLPKGVRLTAEGETLLRFARSALDSLEQGERVLSQMLRFERGVLNIGATETALHCLLLPAMEHFRADHPNIAVNLFGSSTPETVDMVRGAQVDFALAVSPVYDTDGLTILPMGDVQDIVIAGPAFSSALAGRQITAEELCGYPLVAVSQDTSARRHIDAYFQRQNASFQPAYSVRTSSAVLPFVQRNLAVGIVPEPFVPDLLHSGDIFQVQLKEAIVPRQMVLFYREDRPLSRLSRAFLGLC